MSFRSLILVLLVSSLCNADDLTTRVTQQQKQINRLVATKVAAGDSGIVFVTPRTLRTTIAGIPVGLDTIYSKGGMQVDGSRSLVSGLNIYYLTSNEYIESTKGSLVLSVAGGTVTIGLYKTQGWVVISGTLVKFQGPTFFQMRPTVYKDEDGNDSLSTLRDVRLAQKTWRDIATTMPSDSTGLATGVLWFDKTTGAIKRKF